ncbi:hypothetical protein, partial [uncultured Microbulbifer sp.]|uniref:hypothetical protein n=1 Tax=uncultured Microbulbifer sp. TaxID=348147 RepID=UPI002634ECB3
CGSLLAYSQLASLAIAKCVGCYGNLGNTLVGRVAPAGLRLLNLCGYCEAHYPLNNGVQNVTLDLAYHGINRRNTYRWLALNKARVIIINHPIHYLLVSTYYWDTCCISCLSGVGAYKGLH